MKKNIVVSILYIFLGVSTLYPLTVVDLDFPDLTIVEATLNAVLLIEDVQVAELTIEQDAQSGVLIITSVEEDIVFTVSVAAELSGRIMAYPNPMKYSDGDGVIAYNLTQASGMELRIYDMAANLVYKNSYVAGANGGRQNYNELPFNSAVTGEQLPSGVYIILLMNDGKVMGKGKFAVVP